ncbi:MAG: ATP-binding protein [Anaerococcus hydrogenalis]|uniref:sensor histidine kinase n=1 Tax=Anaerococcus hydrogenalis TaxID=33029 RepID=UPI00290A929B|nr:ATP-binding protein [Anaerococcus hydrogenalis]MDU3687642.1 ATP-binding protein [Anaerococcus hydrogenalis]
MKKIINRNINIITSSLIFIIFIVSCLFSYNKEKKAQDEFVENSLSFLTYMDIDKDNLDDFKNSYDLDILLKDSDGKVLYNSGIDKNIIKNYEFDNTDIVKKFKKNFIKKEENNFAKKYKGRILAIKYYNDSLVIYIFKRSYLLIIGILLMLLINIYITNSLHEKLLNPFKDRINDKKEFNNFKNDPKFYIENFNNQKNLLIEENLKLKSRILNIEKITSNMEEGFIYFDKNGNIQVLNEAAKNLLGIKRDQKLDNLVDNDDYKLALRQTRLLKRGKNISIDLDEISVKLFIDPIIDKEIVSYIIIVIDDSKNKKAEIMRREFTANVTHELKSPLTSINGYAELIATGLVKNDDIKKFGQIINEEGNRLLNIIDDILKLSKLDEENLEEGRNEINIKNVVESCIQRFKRLTDKKNIKIVNEIDDIFIRTHESLFTDLITNIYENAIKYNKVNGQIAIKYIKDRRFIKLIIEDKGIGIKKEDLPRIFERFYVADKQRTRTLKSTGLGLSIVKHICDYLNYDIKVESKYGYGTRFIISIPYK